jgi:single-strand DNA-binding protein
VIRVDRLELLGGRRDPESAEGGFGGGFGGGEPSDEEVPF